SLTAPPEGGAATAAGSLPAAATGGAAASAGSLPAAANGAVTASGSLHAATAGVLTAASASVFIFACRLASSARLNASSSRLIDVSSEKQEPSRAVEAAEQRPRPRATV